MWEKALKGAKAYAGFKAIKSLKKAADLGDDLSEALLDRLGLERKSTATTVFGGIGTFAVGILVGSALGVVFAPMAGSQMRSTFRESGVKGVMEKSRAAASAVPSA